MASKTDAKKRALEQQDLEMQMRVEFTDKLCALIKLGFELGLGREVPAQFVLSCFQSFDKYEEAMKTIVEDAKEVSAEVANRDIVEELSERA
jgi:uncharacterized membrane protein